MKSLNLTVHKKYNTCLIIKCIGNTNVEFVCLQQDQLERYIPKGLVYAILWAMGGDGKLKVRQDLGDFIRSVTTIPLPSQSTLPIIDFEVSFIIYIFECVSRFS